MYTDTIFFGIDLADLFSKTVKQVRNIKTGILYKHY